MASGIYQRFLANLMNKIVDLEADEIKLALLNNSHTFDGADNTWADVSANEISGTGYTAGGETLTTKTVTQGATTLWDADNVQWVSASFTAYHAVLYDTTAADNLIASVDFGGAQSITDGTFEIQWQVTGIITLSE